MREWNKILNKYGYEIEGAVWCKDCYDIYRGGREDCKADRVWPARGKLP